MENEKFKIENGVLTKYSGSDEIIEIPNTVSVIGKEVFRNKNARKIIIPNSVKIIEKNAFRDSGIAEIIMNDGVIIIGKAAFWNARCNSITFSKNLREIQDSAFYFFKFYHCEIEKIELPASIEKIGKNAFESSELIVTLPKNVQEIGESAYECTDIQEIIIPSKINVISESAFRSCSNLEKVVIENATKDIISYHDNYGEGEKYDYHEYDEEEEKKETIVSTTKIKDSAFGNCENLKEIFFPNTLAEIGEYAFRFCSLLKRVNIIVNENLKINYHAFDESGLEELYIVTTKYLNIQYGAFEYLPNLKKIKIIGTENSRITIESYSFKSCKKLEELNIVTKGIVEIKESAFESCSELEEINIVAKGIRIGDNTFKNCTLLKRVSLQAGIQGTRIENCAFSNCSLLHTVNISPNVGDIICENSFEDCTSLEKINCDKRILLKKNVLLSKYTPEEIMTIIKDSEEIEISLRSRKEENYYESQNTYNKYEKDEQKNEQVEKILQKLEEIDKSIKKLSQYKGESYTSLDSNTIEDIVEGIWDIL